MSVDHRGVGFGMTQKFLDMTYVDAAFELMGSVAMAQHVRGHAVWDAHAFSGSCDDVSDGSYTVLAAFWSFNKVCFWLVES